MSGDFRISTKLVGAFGVLSFTVACAGAIDDAGSGGDESGGVTGGARAVGAGGSTSVGNGGTGGTSGYQGTGATGGSGGTGSSGGTGATGGTGGIGSTGATGATGWSGGTGGTGWTGGTGGIGSTGATGGTGGIGSTGGTGGIGSTGGTGICIEGDQVATPDGCNTCTCHEDRWICTLMACPDPVSVACGGGFGDTCQAGEYCAYEEGDSCGLADASSVCKARPALCSTAFAPVCGCDGLTYSNSCVAAGAGTGVYTSGSCD